MKRRFYILGLSLLVLVIALAGLLSVLETLPKSPSNTTPNPGGNTAAPPPTTSQPGDTPDTPLDLTPDINLSPDFQVSLPDSFNLDITKALEPGLGLDGTLPPHYPLMEVTGAENTAYLKSLTASYFDGTEWLQDDLSGYVPYNGELIIPPDLDPETIVTDNITVATLVDIVNGKVAIPTSLYPVSVNSSEPLLYFPDDMTFISEEEFPEEYIFETIHYIFDRRTLANADLDLIQEYLQLPANITPRTRELADNITDGIESPYLMAKAIEDYLKTEYTYSFDTTPAPDGWEPNDWFLFEEESGVCTNFNSAFVVLARAAGIPARMAGGFAVTPQEEAQTVYADQAHAWAEVKFQQLGWQTFDATGSPATDENIITLIDTVTEITNIGATAAKGDEFTVAGTVWTDDSAPAEGALVEILVNTTKSAEGAVTVGKGVVSQGRFSIQTIIPGDMEVGNYQVIAHSLKSARYNESWSDPSIKVVSGTNIKIAVPDKVKVGQAVTINGLLSGKYGEALAGQKLGITLDGQSAPSVITDDTGRFNWKTMISEPGQHTVQAYFAGSEYFLETINEVMFQVLAPAVIELQVKDTNAGKPVTISGTLKEQITGTPLESRTISITIDVAIQETMPITDSQGRYDLEYTFNDAGGHTVTATFPGDADYYETSAAVNLEVKEAGAFTAWPIIIIVIAAAAAGTGGWFLYKRMKTRQNMPLTIDGEISPEDGGESGETKPWQSSSPGITLAIDFPQIKQPLPDVWGYGEELQVSLRLADDDGNGIAGTLEVSSNDEAPTSITTGDDGRASLTLTFPAKGKYSLNAGYEDKVNDKKASAARPIRIVDYREEIVGLFNNLTAEFRAKGIAISEEYTPRKIQYLVLNAKLGIPEKALEDAVNCFEETDYSLHRITRQHYETMYLAQKEIREHDIQSAAASE